MITKLKQWFEQLNQTKETAETEQFKESIEICCFSLMVLTANIDASFDPAERSVVEQLGKDLFDLDDATINDIILDAEQQAGDSTSLYEFTSLIHAHLSEHEKFRLVKGLWRIAFADGRIDKYEEHIIRRVAELIYLDHARFTEARHIAENSSL